MTGLVPASRVSRAATLLLVALLALATALGLQLAHPLTAAAATGPTVVDDRVDVSVRTFSVVLPGAQNDLAGSTAIQRGLTVFTAGQPAPLPAGSSVADKLLYDSGFGTWKIAGDGRMTFETSAHVTGTRSVRYRITDAGGLSDEGLATVRVTAGAGDDLIETTQGTTASVDLLANDLPGRNADGTPGTLDRSSLRFRAQQGAPVTLSSDGLVATFPSKGVFTINPATGRLTFVPELAYVSLNESYSLYYTGQDTTTTANGSVEHHPLLGQVRWNVTALDRLQVTETATPALYFHVGDTLTFKTVIKNIGSTPLNGLALAHTLGTRLANQVCTPVAVGGTLAVGATTTCTATTRAKQGDFDITDRVEDLVTVTATTTQGSSTVTARVRAGASTATRITQGLAMTATASPSTVSTVGQRIDYSFAVRNKGNRSLRNLIVSASSRGVPALVCSPSALGGSLGDNRTTTCTATRIVTAADLKTPSLTATAKATAIPVSGAHPTAANAGATVAVRVQATPPVIPTPPAGSGPVVAADSASTTVGRPVIVNVLANDRPGAPARPLVGSSVRLRTSAALPPGSALYGDAKTLKVAGRGVFLVSGTGQITFVPLGTATGPVPTVGYQVADVNGSTARTTLSVTVG